MRRAVAVLCAALVAGCGSSPLSAGDLRNAASAICRSASAELARVGSPTTPAGAVRFLHQGTLILAPELKQLTTLHASGQAGQEYEGALGAFRHKLAQIQDTERALGRGEDPLSSIQALEQQVASRVTEENRHWEALGIPACFSR